MKALRHFAERSLKQVYVRLVRGLAWALRGSGVLGWLEAGPDPYGTRRWLASLLAIYDIEGLIRLDVPWWTYGAIAKVDAFLASKPVRAFEYGSGASTVWLARRAAHVTSVEHDRGWHALVNDTLKGLPDLCPVVLTHVPARPDPAGQGRYPSQKAVAQGLDFEDYARAIERTGGVFDVIVIDGRVREACLRHALPFLAPDGMIVFDNSHRARYQAVISRSGMAARLFRGLAPALPYSDETTLLSHRAE